jgi:DNA invertase Pin-like site-specific DNA recombinase
MITAIYARVSTDDKGQDPLNQVLSMPAHDPSLAFIDYASGKSGDRCEFQRMLHAAERKEFELLVFWSFDRLTREGALETLQYLKRLDDLGIAWKSLTEPYLDSCGPFKDVMIAMIATAAKMERERMSARVKAGMARIKVSGTKTGKPVGRPQINLGVECRALRAQGLTMKEISRRLGVSAAYVCNQID